MADNTMLDIKKFLSTPENPISIQEFKAFWDSLTDEEIAEFKKEELPSK